MADGGDHRHRHARNCARDRFFVERPEILDRSAAAPDDHDIHAFDAPDLPQRPRYLRHRIVALHAGRADDEMRVRVAASKDFDDVAQRGAVEGGDDPNLPRQRRQRTLAFGVEQPLGLQLFLQLLERELPRAEPVRFEVLADELIFALGLVHRDLAARDHAQTIGRLELQVPERRTEHKPAQLRARVLEREIEMAGIPDLTAGQFALDPDLEEMLLEKIANPDGQLGDGQNPSKGRQSAVIRPSAVGRRRGFGLTTDD